MIKCLPEKKMLIIALCNLLLISQENISKYETEQTSPSLDCNL